MSESSTTPSAIERDEDVRGMAEAPEEAREASPEEEPAGELAAADATAAEPAATEEPAAEETPAAEAEPAEELAPEEAPAEVPAPEDATATEPVVGAVASEAAAAEEPAAEEAPAADATAAGPVADVAVTEEPATEKAPAAEEPVTEDAAPAEPAAATAEPATAAPVPVPGPPAGVPVAPAAPKVAPAPDVPLDPAEVAAASAFGRVDAEMNIYVRDAAGEHQVGQYPGATEEDALAFYVRRYLDLVAQVRLFESRIHLLGSKEMEQSLASLKEQVAEPQAVGDLDGLRTRVALLDERIALRQAEIQAEREAARAAALARREEIVSAAEAISVQDVNRTQWKDSGESLHSLLEEWKSAQRSGPRLDKASEDELWKRFSKARTAFDRNRRQFFAERDSLYEAAKRAKEDLIARAEAMQNSTDWGRTSGEYRELMREWKESGRARRKDDDELWARFRAAQQVFFDARDTQNQVVDQEYGENLKVKEAILEEAEALLPVRDARDARQKLRALGERWDAAGRVPRNRMAEVEGRMRAVEQAVKAVEDAEWRRSNPETEARVNSATTQLEAAIAALEEDLEKARAKGDEKAIRNAEEALSARRAWLDQISRSNL